ncbi:MAG TPA: lysozyme inhibitor LprI family protein [Candidatus Acidoferrales bacterium]
MWIRRPRRGSGAKTAVEKVICSDPKLTALDGQLNESYKNAMKKAGEADVVVRHDERAWLADLGENCAGAEIAGCIEKRYTQRIGQLNATAAFDPAKITEYKTEKASRHFDFKIRMFAKPVAAGDDSREGPGHLLVYAKGAAVPAQTIAMDNIFVSLDKTGAPLVNSAKLYDYQGAINVGDFNFDGHEDFAVQNGNEGAYHGPSYDVYLYAPGKNAFEFSKPLSDLIAGSLGFFRVDEKNKAIITFSKDGCCLHQTTHYVVVNNVPVPTVRETEDATQGDKWAVVTDERWLGGKWKKLTAKRVPQDKRE